MTYPYQILIRLGNPYEFSRSANSPRNLAIPIVKMFSIYECQGENEPSEWLADGKPDIDYVKQNFKCGECGGKAEKQVRTTPVLFNAESAYQGMFKRETKEVG